MWGGGLALFLLAASTPIEAQERSDDRGPSVRVGSTVRIQMPDSVVEGEVVEVDGETWRVNVDGLRQDRTEVGPESVSRVEVKTGRQTNVLKGMGIGLLAGGASGALIGLATADEDAFFSENLQIAGAAVTFGALGLVAGTIIGAIPRDRWEEVAPPGNLRISPQTGGGVALSGSIEF